MPTINSIAKVVAKPLPRVISPKTQAILDYLLVGSFLGTASWFWRHNNVRLSRRCYAAERNWRSLC